jgi:GT2 family glycosyltransferase
MNIDVIILSNTKDLTLYGLTQRTINTLRFSENINFDIKIIESNKKYLEQGFVYDSCKVIIPNEEFGYNKFLNYGLKECQNDWVVVANNDLIFTKNWLTKLLEYNKNNQEVLSLSPWEPTWHVKRGMNGNIPAHIGYRTSFEITGWCLLIHKSVIDKCSLFDPQFMFWYQDNDYGLTLQKHNIKHALVTSSRVYHMVSGSHHLLEDKNKFNMTDGQLEILRKKWGPNV